MRVSASSTFSQIGAVTIALASLLALAATGPQATAGQWQRLNDGNL